MKQTISIEGYAYRFRPVSIDDASIIIDIRLEDEQRNRFIHKISKDINEQKEWIKGYLSRDNDYYFVVENILNNKAEGLISIYDINDKVAEWGRWVIRKNSLAATESVYLMYKVAFNILNLDKVYSRTIADNTEVVNFHNSLPQKHAETYKDFFELNGIKHDAIEHYVDKQYFYDKLFEKLDKRAHSLFDRNLKHLIGAFEFNHIGVATVNIEKSFLHYKMLGYRRDGHEFVDNEQKIKGQFIIANGQPRLELLENSDGGNTLDFYLANKITMYHYGYLIKDIEKALNELNKLRIKIISPLKQSMYFKKRICFLIQPNRFMIELIEV